MIESLYGLPGKIKTLLDRLTDNRATKLDNLDATISSRAPASTALSSNVWTNNKADYVDTYISSIKNAGGGGGGGSVIYFTSSGTFTVPDNVYSITVRVVGGGGGGGTSNVTTRGGAGGGGGGFATQIIATSPGTQYTVTVGGSGGTSSFVGNGVDVGATGGEQGGNWTSNNSVGPNPPGGSGGMGYNGFINTKGANGRDGGNESYYYGGSSGQIWGNSTDTFPYSTHPFLNLNIVVGIATSNGVFTGDNYFFGYDYFGYTWNDGTYLLPLAGAGGRSYKQGKYGGGSGGSNNANSIPGSSGIVIVFW